MVTLIFYFAIVLLCCAFAEAAATSYAKNHNVNRKDVMPFWPTIFYGCGAITTVRLIDYIFKYFNL